MVERTCIPGTLTAVARWMADRLICRSMASHFRAVYARVAEPPAPDRPTIVFANHHYWWDGYLCHLLGRRWGQPMNLWMEEWRWFPPFWALGALPYPPGDTMARARTLRHTLRLLQQPPRVLFLFPEGILHTGYHLLPFQRSLYWLAQHVPEVQLLPLAIVITTTLHQYPRAFLHMDAPFRSHSVPPEAWLAEAQQKVVELVDVLRQEAECLDTAEKAQEAGFVLLVRGKTSVNERWWARMMP